MSARCIAATTGPVMFLAASTVIACQCGALNFSRRIAEADLVLVATVSSFKALDHVTVLPIEIFKGSTSKALTIQTGLSDCDFFLPPVSPKIGEEYLLYLRQAEGRLTASRCLASGRTTEKTMELRALRKRFTPNAQTRRYTGRAAGGAPLSLALDLWPTTSICRCRTRNPASYLSEFSQ
jgi:hypothetical protein